MAGGGDAQAASSILRSCVIVIQTERFEGFAARLPKNPVPASDPADPAGWRPISKTTMLPAPHPKAFSFKLEGIATASKREKQISLSTSHSS